MDGEPAELCVNVRTFVELGRTSNLPTVWSNLLCGGLLALLPEQRVPVAVWAWLAVGGVAASAFYWGGMMLNDAFDASWDAQHRPERPIPSGRVSRSSVFSLGFLLLFGGIALLVTRPLLTGAGRGAVVAGIGTALAILAYDRFHKGFGLAPVVMGACRAGVYAIGAWTATDAPGTAVFVALGASWAYVVGLTHVARFETGSIVSRWWVAALVFSPALAALWLATGDGSGRLPAAVAWLLHVVWSGRAITIARSSLPGNIPRAVVALIAGISLADAAMLAAAGWPWVSMLAGAAFLLTLWAQRLVAGT